VKKTSPIAITPRIKILKNPPKTWNDVIAHRRHFDRALKMAEKSGIVVNKREEHLENVSLWEIEYHSMESEFSKMTLLLQQVYYLRLYTNRIIAAVTKTKIIRTLNREEPLLTDDEIEAHIETFLEQLPHDRCVMPPQENFKLAEEVTNQLYDLVGLDSSQAKTKAISKLQRTKQNLSNGLRTVSALI